jgi:hypothetical protein
MEKIEPYFAQDAKQQALVKSPLAIKRKNEIG